MQPRQTRHTQNIMILFTGRRKHGKKKFDSFSKRQKIIYLYMFSAALHSLNTCSNSRANTDGNATDNILL